MKCSNLYTTSVVAILALSACSDSSPPFEPEPPPPDEGWSLQEGDYMHYRLYTPGGSPENESLVEFQWKVQAVNGSTMTLRETQSSQIHPDEEPEIISFSSEWEANSRRLLRYTVNREAVQLDDDLFIPYRIPTSVGVGERVLIGDAEYTIRERTTTSVADDQIAVETWLASYRAADETEVLLNFETERGLLVGGQITTVMEGQPLLRALALTASNLSFQDYPGGNPQAPLGSNGEMGPQLQRQGPLRQFTRRPSVAAPQQLGGRVLRFTAPYAGSSVFHGERAVERSGNAVMPRADSPANRESGEITPLLKGSAGPGGGTARARTRAELTETITIEEAGQYQMRIIYHVDVKSLLLVDESTWKNLPVGTATGHAEMHVHIILHDHCRSQQESTRSFYHLGRVAFPRPLQFSRAGQQGRREFRLLAAVYLLPGVYDVGALVESYLDLRAEGLHTVEGRIDGGGVVVESFEIEPADPGTPVPVRGDTGIGCEYEVSMETEVTVFVAGAEHYTAALTTGGLHDAITLELSESGPEWEGEGPFRVQNPWWADIGPCTREAGIEKEDGLFRVELERDSEERTYRVSLFPLAENVPLETQTTICPGDTPLVATAPFAAVFWKSAHLGTFDWLPGGGVHFDGIRFAAPDHDVVEMLVEVNTIHGEVSVRARTVITLRRVRP